MTNWKQGELPPVGEECYVLNSKFGNSDWEKCVVRFKGNHIIVYDSESCSERTVHITDCQFKPIKTPAEIERDRVVGLFVQQVADFYGNPKPSIGYEALGRKLYACGLLSDPEKRVKGIGFDEFSKAFYMETCLATYDKWVEEGYIQGVDNDE